VLGWGVVGSNTGEWVPAPGPNFAIGALGTLVAGAARVIDWTTAGYFTMTLPSTGTNALSFTSTGAPGGEAAGVVTPSVGQVIRLRITGGGGGTVSWPSGATITWLSGGSAPTLTGSLVTVIELVCTGYQTFDGTFSQS
jgi:hypothetical protein